MPRADDLCPLGFAPHAVRPTRCKRCFRDYSDHKPKNDPKTAKKDDDSKSGIRRRERNDSKPDIKEDLQKESEKDKKDTTERRRRRSEDEILADEKKDDSGEKSSAEAKKEEVTSTTSSGFRRRRDNKDDSTTEDENNSSTRNRTRVRPSSSVAEDANKADHSRSPSPTSSRRNSEGSAEEITEKKKRTRQRLQILSAQEVNPADLPGVNSDEDTSADVAFILQVKTSTSKYREDDEETMSTAPTDITETTLTYGDSVENLQLQVQQLKTQLDASEDKYAKLETEKKELEEKRKKDLEERESLEKSNTDLLKLKPKIREYETAVEDLKDENKVLKLEIKETQEEMEKRPSHEEVQRTIDELRGKLVAAETLCEELMEENEDIKREIRDLEDEIEEMQDNFREDQADEYSILKKELEQTAKNCRILQFKLRKAEKRCDHLESDKNQYEDKLKDLVKSGHLDVNQAEKLKQMELELKTAREVSIQMHTEMESLQNKLRHLQEERETLSKKMTADGTIEGSSSRSPSPLAKKDFKPEIHTRPKDQGLDLDPSQLLRDLYDTIERENDLKEQLRFTEEEAQNLRKKLSFLEQENETLVLQIKKMASSKRAKDARQRPPSREGSRDDDSGISDDTEELSASELQLQVEIFEEETGVLRRKVEELDAENQNLQKEVKELQDKLAEKPTLKMDLPSQPPTDPAKANIFYEQKVKLLENEAKELRIKLIDKERENERLNSELTMKQRKGSKASMMTRSRSLDSDTQVDLKRQLQLVEQEALILRAKTLELENENDKLSSENHRLQMRVGKKAPLTSQQELAAENNRLKEKVDNLEKKLKSSSKESLIQPTDGSLYDDAAVASLKEQVLYKEKEISNLKEKFESVSKENEKLNTQLKTVKDKSKVETKKWKKIPDSAPKLEFKKALEELEGELNKLTAIVKSKDCQCDILTSDLKEQKKALEFLKDDSKHLEEKYKKQIDELNKKNENLSKNLGKEKESLNQINEKLKQLEKEKADVRSPSPKGILPYDEVKKLKEQVETLKKNLEDEKNRSKSPGSSGTVRFEELRKVEEDKHRIQKQLTEYQRKYSESEKKLSEMEQSNKEMEKVQRSLRRQIDDLSSELDQEKTNLKKVDNRQTEVAMGWLKERDELKRQMSDLQKKMDLTEKEVEDKDKKIRDQDDVIHQDRKKRDNLQHTLQQKEEDLKHVKENNSKLKAKLKELEEKFSKVDKDMEELTDKWRKLDILYKKEKEEWGSKNNDLESQLKVEVKRRERIEQQLEREQQDRDEEMIRMREKVRKTELEMKKMAAIAEDTPINISAQEKIKDLQEKLAQEKQEYDDLTSKYEMLEEEHVLTKARLVSDKEQIQANVDSLQKDYSQLDGELKTVRETFNLRQDTWIKDKLDMQEKIKDLEEKLIQADAVGWQDEVRRLKRLLEDKNGLIEQYKKEERHQKDELDRLKRQGDDLRNKLNDLERAERSVGRGYGSDYAANKELQDLKHNLLKAEVEELRTKLQQEEKVHRSEVTAMKMMNDVKMAQMQDEVQMLHIQIGKFRRERDTYKEILDGAQKTIADLKTDSLRRRGSTGTQEVEDMKTKLQDLRKLVEKLQDQLDNADRTNSQLKMEHVTEKASWEIKVSEMQTKVNELEESIILQGGKSRIYGVKTKLELAWQKEREEQQRLLNESHRMAKELRHRVVDLENARERERQEAKRQLEDLRKTVETDQGDTQLKISELQADLLELRDAHAKMRNTNDRIKREREKLERERDELKMKMSENQHFLTEDLAKISSMSEELSKLSKLVPIVLGEQVSNPTIKTSAAQAEMQKIKENFRTALTKITETTEEFRRLYGIREEERVRRNLSFRRAMSATDSDLDAAKPPLTPTRTRKDDPLSRWQNPQRVTNYPASPPSMLITPPRTRANTALFRKSLSLDQSLTVDQLEKSIWKSESEAGSTTSLEDTAVVHSRSRSSGGEYSTVATLQVPAAGPSPLPRKKKKFQSSQSSLESASPSSSRDASVEKELKTPPPRPPSPGLTASSPALSHKSSKDSNAVAKKPPLSGGTAKERFFTMGKSRSIEETPTGESVAQAGVQAMKPGLGISVGNIPKQSEKNKDFKSKISNIFKKPPSRTSSLDSADKDGAMDVASSASKGLKPPTDPKQKTQYKSTGSLHTTRSGSQESDISSAASTTSYHSASLPRRILRRLGAKSKSIDDPYQIAKTTIEEEPRKSYTETAV